MVPPKTLSKVVDRVVSSGKLTKEEGRALQIPGGLGPGQIRMIFDKLECWLAIQTTQFGSWVDLRMGLEGMSQPPPY